LAGSKCFSKRHLAFGSMLCSAHRDVWRFFVDCLLSSAKATACAALHYLTCSLDFSQIDAALLWSMIGRTPPDRVVGMNSVVHFFRGLIQGISPVEAAASPRSTASKALDCVYILGPGHSEAMAHELRRRALHEGLTTTVIGDGSTEITREMIHDARQRGLIGPDTQVIGLLHGGTQRVKGNAGVRHILHTGFKASTDAHKGIGAKKLTPTTEFLHWLRDPLPEGRPVAQQAKPWGGTIHLASCHVSTLKKEISPVLQNSASEPSVQDALWTHGHVLLYGSNKPVLNDVSLQNFDSLLRHLGDCKRQGRSATDVAETFRRVMVQSADTVTLLGGALTEPLVSPAPKTLLEATPGYLQCQWQ
jgi:hypothetical protein